MNYLCCPIACLVGHARWLSQLYNNLFDRSNQNDRWTLIEESHQETPTISRSHNIPFFQTAPSDPSITPSSSPVCKK